MSAPTQVAVVRLDKVKGTCVLFVWVNRSIQDLTACLSFTDVDGVFFCKPQWSW